MIKSVKKLYFNGRNKMKKTGMALLMGVITAVSLTGCASKATDSTTAAQTETTKAVETTAAKAAQGGGNLVIYSPNSEGLMNATIPLFEEKYGVNVEVIQAGTGELVKRIQSEKNDPYGDILFGGSWSLAYDNKSLWEPYVSANNDNVIDAYKNTCGFITGNVLDGSVLIVNTDLLGDIQINGYKDLLNPELKGKIATADPANSSSAFAQLTNMLLAMGGYEDEAAWKYVDELFGNIEGKICESSSAVYKGVADGEYVVGLSYEDPCAQLVRDGAPVKIVYPQEGTVYLPASATIIKGAKNMDNAKLFLDFILSDEVQNIWGSTLTNRPVIKNAETSDFMKPISDIKVLEEDIPYVSGNKQKIVDRYTEIFTDLQSK
jgi:iron(III) transport system substrate-binding protein